MALHDPKRPALMVFTRDHEDAGDRERVRENLRALLDREGFRCDLRYKTDEATAAGVYSGKNVRGVGGGGGEGAGGGSRVVSQYHDVGECRFFSTPDGCRFGDACKWRHG